jgi:hypothetical protein
MNESHNEHGWVREITAGSERLSHGAMQAQKVAIAPLASQRYAPEMKNWRLVFPPSMFSPEGEIVVSDAETEEMARSLLTPEERAEDEANGSAGMVGESSNSSDLPTHGQPQRTSPEANHEVS